MVCHSRENGNPEAASACLGEAKRRRAVSALSAVRRPLWEAVKRLCDIGQIIP
jgi:hypothetical protein